MDLPRDDSKIEDIDQNVTAHPGGAEGAPASVDSTKENKDLLSEHNSIPEVEVSNELKDAGVRKNQPTSLNSDLQEHISKAVDITPKTAQPSQNNVTTTQANEEGNVRVGGTWIDALLKKFSLIGNMLKP